MSNVAIIKYNGGNGESVLWALERLGASACWTNDVEQIKKADHVIFPGVGHAKSALANLRASGLDRVIPHLRQPVLGICLGMQLLCSSTEEGDCKGYGIFPMAVKKFAPELKVPHMGWNLLSDIQSPLLSDLPREPYAYFLHSYYVESSPYTVAFTDYGIPFSAAVQVRNFSGVQFHPEKSGAIGEKILSNFLEQRP